VYDKGYYYTIRPICLVYCVPLCSISILCMCVARGRRRKVEFTRAIISILGILARVEHLINCIKDTKLFVLSGGRCSVGICNELDV